MIEADAGSTVTIGGIIDNTGLVFSPTGTGTIAITGTVDGGTVDAGTGTNLVLAGSTLNNVTLSGNYQLTDNSFIYIQNNLTLDGTLTLGDSSSYGVLYFISGGSQTLGGSGTVLFSGTTPNDSLALYGGTLTIGSGITVQGQNGYVGYSSLTGAAKQHYRCQPGDHPGRRQRRKHHRLRNGQPECGQPRCCSMARRYPSKER